MVPQRHIINEQILEMHLPEGSDAFAMQQKLGRLYREQLVPVIDKILSERYGNDEKSHCRIDELTIDLGRVQMEDMATVFAEEFDRAIASHKDRELSEGPVREDADNLRKTPLKVLSHYLMTGILPWWSEATAKAYLLEQLNALLETPDNTFKELLGQLRYNTTYLNRFLNTFTEEQVLRSLQLLTTFPVNGLPEKKNKLVKLLQNTPGEWPHGLTDFRIAKAFWAAAFNRISTAANASDLESRSIRQAFLALGANPDTAEKWFSRSRAWTGVEAAVHGELSAIRSLVAKLKTQYPGNRIWQQFFRHLSGVVYHPSISLVNARLLEELKQLLQGLEEARHKSTQRPDRQEGEWVRPLTPVKTITETHLQPLAKQLHLLETTMRQLQPVPAPDVIEKLRSEFEDTDFIPVQNAGLVLLWPFLQRFFENMDLIAGKAFHDETARNKAVCALQYLADEEEEVSFEGMLTLNKVLCGIPPEDPVEPLPLSTGEKDIAEGLLHSVISRGPHWKNLSPAGFRASYVRREGLLRSRDGHWLLQVKKETYDVTLEKLPWGFAAVKLPWMQEPLMVEWI